ncbi:BQ5605_C049g12431 [Microbotryum silenes-dioicae]|uniref:alpha-1,2-Mannosidase n=1 Tax=Microbotryum silenes-dioicae TaxID=796604 RepID=A0A2X0MSP5_9BASI|nr:BQ5605_C049g12431 [Microbotryum silenes-dioicae]
MTILDNDEALPPRRVYSGVTGPSAASMSTMSLSSFPPRPPLGFGSYRGESSLSTDNYYHYHPDYGRSPYTYAPPASHISNESLLLPTSRIGICNANVNGQTFERYPQTSQPYSLGWTRLNSNTKLIRALSMFGCVCLVYIVPRHGPFGHPRHPFGGLPPRFSYDQNLGDNGVAEPINNTTTRPTTVNNLDDGLLTGEQILGLPLDQEYKRYASRTRLIPPTWPDPWSRLPDEWKGRAWLAEERFAGGRAHDLLSEQTFPPQQYVVKAYEYTRELGRQANLHNPKRKPPAGIRYLKPALFDEHTGRPLQVPRSELRLSHEGWKKPQFKVGDLGKPGAFGRSAKRPKVQYAGKIDMSKKRVTEEKRRREWVKRAFMHAWEGYKKQWGHDEVAPVSGSYSDRYNGWGATIVDSLDTLLIMGLNEEYNLAREHVSAVDFSYLLAPLSFSDTLPRLDDMDLPTAARPRSPPRGPSDSQAKPQKAMPLFETVIRYLGGLISAYDLSDDPLMLTRAIELGDWLLPALNTDFGVPKGHYEPGTNPDGTRPGRTSLAEVGSLSLEFTRLSMISGDETYFQAVQRTMDTLDTRFPRGKMHGARQGARLGQLLPSFIDTSRPEWLSDVYSFGAASDSYYEYLMKMAHLLGNYGPDAQYARMYREVIDSAYEYLIRAVDVLPGQDHLTNIGEFNAELRPTLQHLSCFAGGMLAVGGKLLARPKDVETGKEYTETCNWAYESTPTGLMPESLTFYKGDAPDRFRVQTRADGTKVREPRGQPTGVRHTATHFAGRPETIESIFEMWRLTGDRKWQDMGWRIFVDWSAVAIAEYGFAGIDDVFQPVEPRQLDVQESYVLAETLKYFYLLFSDRELLSLDQYVFSTEAHPFKLPTAPGQEPPRFWTGPGEPKQQGFQSRVGEGTRPQLWSRVQQAAAFSHLVPVLSQED